MAEATWDNDTPEPPKHSKEELVRALFRANELLTREWSARELQEANALAAQHARFMREGEAYVDFIKVREKLELEGAVTGV